VKTLAAFAIIYFVWGSTFLAIRVGVREVPPFLLAGLRFTTAGAMVYGWAALRGEPRPDARQWRSTLLLGLILIVVCYGLLFWSEQRVTSGMAAVLAGTIPMFMALAEVLVLRTQRLTPVLVGALLLGIAGVAVLTSETLIARGTPVDRLGAAALIFGSAAWAVGSVLTRVLPLPASGTMRAGGQMLAGGVMLLLLAAALGEFGRFSPAEVSVAAWLALGYLIVAGSIVAYTAYIWLLQHQSPTRVGSYAYVNPVVAVLLGALLLDEPLDARTVTGSLLVLVSVVGVMTRPARWK
jgi:drug/metabolite transporter (DMT)-like permease